MHDMIDCFHALNTLPDREKRNLLKRIKDRIHYVFTTNETTSAFNHMTKFGDIFKPEFYLPFFEDKHTDHEILKYSFIGKHFEKGAKTPYNEKEVISEVVRQFCPDLD